MEHFKIESGTLGLFLFKMKHFFVETITFLVLRPKLILPNLQQGICNCGTFFLLRWNQTYICDIKNIIFVVQIIFLDETTNL
jgi:hypothetical protein